MSVPASVMDHIPAQRGGAYHNIPGSAVLSHGT